jgi:hypothetical protein
MILIIGQIDQNTVHGKVLGQQRKFWPIPEEIFASEEGIPVAFWISLM